MWKYPTRTLPSLNTSAPLQGVGLKMYYIRNLFRSGLATLIVWSTTARTMRTRLPTIFTILLSSCSSRLSFFKFLANFGRRLLSVRTTATTILLVLTSSGVGICGSRVFSEMLIVLGGEHYFIEGYRRQIARASFACFLCFYGRDRRLTCCSRNRCSRFGLVSDWSFLGSFVCRSLRSIRWNRKSGGSLIGGHNVLSKCLNCTF